MDNNIKTIGDQIERLTRSSDTDTLDVSKRLFQTGLLTAAPLAVQNGTVVRREDLMDRPLVRKEMAVISSVDSFVAYVNRHKQAKSVVFANENSETFDAVIDYEDDKGVLNKQHGAKLKLQRTFQANAWIDHNRTHFSQTDFAEFLEANLGDIVDPEPATMMSVATGLQIKKDVQFDSKVQLNNGSLKFAYQEDVRGSVANGNIEIPASFKIGIVLYRGQPEGYSMECKLRYRVTKEEGLIFWYVIPLLDRAIETAFADVKKQILSGVNRQGDAPLEMFDVV